MDLNFNTDENQHEEGAFNEDFLNSHEQETELETEQFPTDDSFLPPSTDDNPDDKSNGDDNPDDAQKNEGDDADDFNFDDVDNQDKNRTEEEIDLEKLNKALGTDAKSIEELKSQLQKEDTVNDRQKEEETFNRNSQTIDYLKDIVAKTPEDLVRYDLAWRAHQAKRDVNSQEVKDEIEDKIETLKSLGELDAKAELLRSNFNSSLEKLSSENASIQSKWEGEKKATAEKNREALRTNFSDLVKNKEFMGVTIDKDAAIDIYKKITDGQFFNEVNSNQRNIAELALMWYNREQIQKNATRPDHSEGVKSVFAQLPGQKNSRSFTTAHGSTGNNGVDADILAFTK